MRYRFEHPWIPRSIAERLTKLCDGPVSADSLTDAAPPHAVEQVIFGDDVAPPGSKIRQQIHDLRPHLSRQAVPGQPALRRLHQPVIQAKVATKIIGHGVVTPDQIRSDGPKSRRIS